MVVHLLAVVNRATTSAPLLLRTLSIFPWMYMTGMGLTMAP